jgi:hypothetical protein
MLEWHKKFTEAGCVLQQTGYGSATQLPRTWDRSDNHFCAANRNQQIDNTMIKSAQHATHVLQTACIQDSNCAGFQAQWSSTTLCICHRHFGMMWWRQWTNEACHTNSWGYLSWLRDCVRIWGSANVHVLWDMEHDTSQTRVIFGLKYVKYTKRNPTSCNSVSKFYFILIWSSTCFKRHSAHHQETKTALSSSGFTYLEGCWMCSCWTPSGRVSLYTLADSIQQLHGQRPSTYAKPEAASIVLGSLSGRHVTQNMLSFISIRNKILIYCCILLDSLCELYYDAWIHEHQVYICPWGSTNHQRTIYLQILQNHVAAQLPNLTWDFPTTWCSTPLRYRGSILPYFSIDNAHLTYNTHPKLFWHSFWCIDNAHEAN